MYKLKKTCKAARQTFPDQRTQYRIIIPVVFADVMQLTDDTRFELELIDADTIVVRKVT